MKNIKYSSTVSEFCIDEGHLKIKILSKKVTVLCLIVEGRVKLKIFGKKLPRSFSYYKRMT